MIELTGRILYPGDREWNAARHGFALAPNFDANQPAVIVFCQSARDASNAIRYIRETDLPFRVRCGRHNYEGYHNKGFEVVAISADEDRDALEKFLAENKSPWINLHDKGGTNPAMEYYGIPGFPTTFLIGKEGKVISLEARGPELSRLLKEQLGEPEAVKPANPAEKPSNVENLEKRMKDILEKREKDKQAEEPKK